MRAPEVGGTFKFGASAAATAPASGRINSKPWITEAIATNAPFLIQNRMRQPFAAQAASNLSPYVYSRSLHVEWLGRLGKCAPICKGIPSQ
jgi:hypothetical protein